MKIFLIHLAVLTAVSVQITPTLSSNEPESSRRREPRVKIDKNVWGYLETMKRFGINNRQDVSFWTSKPERYRFTTNENRKQLEYLYTHLNARWSHWRQLSQDEDFRKHFIESYINACGGLRRYLKLDLGSRSEMNSRVQGMINNILYSQYAGKIPFDENSAMHPLDLAVLDCELKLNNGITIHANLLMKNQKRDLKIESPDETFLVLLEGKTDNSFFSYFPVDLVGLSEIGYNLRNLKDEKSYSRAAKDVKISRKQKEPEPSIGKPELIFYLRDLPSDLIRFSVFDKRWGYLASMRIYRIHERRDIRMWTDLHAINYDFTHPLNQEFLKSIFKNFEDTWTHWKNFYQEPDTVKEHIVESYALACKKFREYVDSENPESTSDLRKRVKRMFAEAERYSIDLSIIFCPLKWTNGNKIQTSVVKRRVKYNEVLDSGSPIVQLPEEEFMILIGEDGDRPFPRQNERLQVCKYELGGFSYYPMDLVRLKDESQELVEVRNVLMGRKKKVVDWLAYKLDRHDH